MRNIEEKNKIYTSFITNKNDVKKDIAFLTSQYPFKYKLDYFSFAFLAVAILFFILIAVNPFFSIGGAVFLIAFIALRYLFVNKKRKVFNEYYKSAILNNGKVKHDGAKVLSDIYPLYLECDNEKETFTLFYSNRIVIFVEYDDILSYEKLNDYKLEILFNNKKKSYVEFLNCFRFTIDLKNDYQMSSNKKSIDELVTVLDNIINKNIA